MSRSIRRRCQDEIEDDLIEMLWPMGVYPYAFYVPYRLFLSSALQLTGGEGLCKIPNRFPFWFLNVDFMSRPFPLNESHN